MLKISTTLDSDNAVLLSVEGSLAGPWVEELRRQSYDALADASAVSLDLEKLWFADQQGVALLRELTARNVTTLHCSAFLREQLKETTR